MSVTREYGTTCREIGIMADLRDIGRRLDALEAGRRSDNDLPDDEFQKKAGREVGWYPVQIIVGNNGHRSWPLCMWWSGTGWRRVPVDRQIEEMSDKFVVAVGPRLDLPEGR